MGPQLHIITIHQYDLYAAGRRAGIRARLPARKMCFPARKWLIAAWRMRFAGVVMLLRCGGRFRRGAGTIGFIKRSPISIATSFGSASIILMLVLVI